MRLPVHLTAIVAGALALLALQGCSLSPGGQAGQNQPFVTIVTSDGATHRFDVELARTDDELRQGLRYRTELAPESGMLFDLRRVRMTSFTMSDTLIPLDMLFLSREGEIVQLYEMTEPLNPGPYPSDIPVRAVLELGGGIAEELQIERGDTVVHPIFKTDSQ